MQPLSSFLLISFCFVTVLALRPRICLNNGAPCKSDGSVGNCCSKNCVQLAGQDRGTCQTRRRITRQSEQCLDNGAACQMDGSQGNCCSGFCLQQEGESEGTCQAGQEGGEHPIAPILPPVPCVINGIPCGGEEKETGSVEAGENNGDDNEEEEKNGEEEQEQSQEDGQGDEADNTEPEPAEEGEEENQEVSQEEPQGNDQE